MTMSTCDLGLFLLQSKSLAFGMTSYFKRLVSLSLIAQMPSDGVADGFHPNSVLMSLHGVACY